jgi:methylenetetrahydrofolate dehydrogenase (NADP+)/methenyltetrahydrofolate cyclohydrolase
MRVLDGKTLQERLALDLEERIARLGTPLILAIVQVGTREESNRYIKHKITFGRKVGAEVRLVSMPEGVSEETVIKAVAELNADTTVTGIIVQLPLPTHISAQHVINAIEPKKDVDGLTSESPFTPATPLGVMIMLKEYGINLSGKRAAVMGRSKLVGAPLAKLFEAAGAKVSVVHSQSVGPREITRSADILAVAIGKPRHVTKDFIQPDAVVIDVGINMREGKLVGDVDFDDVKDTVSAISPVPGGVGPMTIYALFENLYAAALLHTRA